MKTKNLITTIITYLVLILVLVIVVFPIIYTVLASFKTNKEVMTTPGALFPINPTFDNYVTAWNKLEVWRMLINSLIYTCWNVTFAVCTSVMSGYVFARGHFPLKNVILYAFTCLMFIQIVGVGVYPTFELLETVSFGYLTTGLFSLMITKVFAVQIVNTYLVRGYVNSLPTALDEAAKIDGCSFFSTLVRIIAPLLKPIIATMIILGFNGSWNDYMMPTIFTITNKEQQTLIVGITQLKSSGGAASQWNLMLAGSAIALVPVLVMYACCNKYFVSGLSAGAVKG